MTRTHPRIASWTFAIAAAAALGATAILPAAAQGPAPSASPPAGSPAPSASPLPTLPPRPPLPDGLLALPVEGGLLEAGTYGSWSLGPLASFTIGDGWAATGPDIADMGWALVRASNGIPALITFIPFEGHVFLDPCLATSEDTIDIEATVSGLISDLAVNPNLIAGPPTEVEVAGFPGLQVDLTTQDAMPCEPPVVWLWSLPQRGDFRLDLGEEARFIALDVDGRVLVIAIEAFPGADYPAFLEEAMSVVESVTIDTDAVAPPASSPAVPD